MAQLRHPVRFTDAVAQLIGEGYRIFLEIGPRPILQSYLSDALRSAEVQGHVLASLSRERSDDDPFPAIAARCHAAGYDWTAAPSFDGPSDPRGLPLYPWNRERFWFAATTEAAELVNPPFDHPLLGFRQRGATANWLDHLDKQVLPWIADHAVEGVAVLPAAAILEMALATARWRWPEAPALEVFDVELRRPMPFDKGRMRELRTSLQSDEGEWEPSRLRLSSEPLTLNAVARVGAATDARRIISWTAGTSAGRPIDGESLYGLAQRAGLDYGPRFRTVSHVEITDEVGAIAYFGPLAFRRWSGSVSSSSGAARWCVSSAPRTVKRPPASNPGRRVSAMAVWPGPPPGPIWACSPPRVAAARRGPGFDRSRPTSFFRMTRGDIVAELADCWFRRVELTRQRSVDERALRIDLVPAPLSKQALFAPLTISARPCRASALHTRRRRHSKTRPCCSMP